MAESQTQDQPQTPGESSGEQLSFREQTAARLADERGESPEAKAPDQPLDADDGYEGEPEDESQSAADQPDDGEVDEESAQGDDQPDATDAPGVFNVDGIDYSADDVRELNEARVKYDTEFRRRTQITARLKREYEVAGQDVEHQSQFFLNLANANVSQYSRFDPSNLSPEQYKAFHDQKTNAERGRDQLNQQLETMRTSTATKREALVNQEAGESIEVLKGIEPRWGDEFYTKVREFAVSSGRYDAQEFENLTDWRSIEGLVALMDRDSMTQRQVVNREPKKPNRRRQRQRQRRRNARGQFQTAQDAVFASPNASRDGSFRAMTAARLAAERGE